MSCVSASSPLIDLFRDARWRSPRVACSLPMRDPRWRPDKFVLGLRGSCGIRRRAAARTGVERPMHVRSRRRECSSIEIDLVGGGCFLRLARCQARSRGRSGCVRLLRRLGGRLLRRSGGSASPPSRRFGLVGSGYFQPLADASPDRAAGRLRSASPPFGRALGERVTSLPSSGRIVGEPEAVMSVCLPLRGVCARVTSLTVTWTCWR